MQGGSDVITKTALKRINWGSYKMNQSSDKIGVFVSVVSTKIPYKGAGKEYIGKRKDCMSHMQTSTVISQEVVCSCNWGLDGLYLLPSRL